MISLQKLMSGVATRIEKMSLLVGHLISWLTLFMVLLVFIVVILRYLFNTGSITLQESVTYLHGMVFLLAAGYTLQQDEHVRVDVFYSQMSHKKRAWIDILGTVFLLFPVCIYILSMSLNFVLLSWKINESSAETGGLPALYLLKSLILVMPILMIFQGFAWILRRLLFLFYGAETPYRSRFEVEVE